MPDPSDLVAAVRKLDRARVLVVGDAMLDRYIFGRINRISPEAPVPVLVVERELAEPGGAGNVVHNLIGLGAACAFVSVIGDDRAGTELTSLIGGQAGVEPWLLVQGGRRTTVKTRFIAEGARRGGQHLLRSDREDIRPIHPKLAERLLRIAVGAISATSVLVLSDYRKGVLAGDVPAQLIAAAKAAGRKIVVDLRSDDWDRFTGADVMILHAHDLRATTDAEVAAAGEATRRAHGFGALLVKRGVEGLSFIDAKGCVHMPLTTAETLDLAGAGDAAVAAMAAALAAGIAPRIAARLATAAAGLIGGVVGSGIAMGAELLAKVEIG